MSFEIVSRDEWGAQPPKGEKDHMNQSKHVLYVHFTSSGLCYNKEECSDAMRILQDRAFEQGSNDIFYNFMVGGDGNIYEGRGWFARPERYRRLHNIDIDCIYIGYLGDFKDDEPNFKQWSTGWEILRIGFEKDYINYREFRLYYCS